MKQKQSEYRDRQRGSATLEAVVGFTAFLLMIFTILGMVNFCRAQMLVSAAMDTAAKEMAQYSYFYEISGLSKFEKSLDMNGQKGTDNINQIIGTVDTLYSSINGAVEQGVQEVKNTQEMVAAGQFDMTAINNSLTSVGNNFQGIEIGIKGVTNAFKDVGNDPLLYMRSIVALLASEGMELAKRAVAIPLTRAFVSKHFGDSTREANEKLKALGIVDGLDGMNFNLSKIFSDAEHKEIELVVHYKVKLMNVFDWVVLEAKLSKVAICRAWLGGDDVQVKVKPDPAPAAPESGGEGGEEKPDDGTEDPTESTESTEPTEEATAPTEPEKTMNSTGNWALQHDTHFYYGSKRYEAFSDLFEEENIFNNYHYGMLYHETEGKTIIEDYDVRPVWNYEPYETMGGNTYDPGAALLESYMKVNIESLAKDAVKSDGTVQEFSMYAHTVYIPENMPEDQYNALLRDAETAKANLQEMIKNDTTGIPKDLKVEIWIVRAGGQYDYNSKESDYTHLEGARQE